MNYKKIYCISRWYKEGDWIPCEICWTTAVEIHHIPNSHRGNKDRNITWNKLLSVCRYHHNLIHSENTFEMREALYAIVDSILTLHNWWEVSTELKKLSQIE